MYIKNETFSSITSLRRFGRNRIITRLEIKVSFLIYIYIYIYIYIDVFVDTKLA